ncbi:tail fiber protein [Moorena sp. SIO2C4]|uniref:tail fiber protein n=1 Tax=Moorena sp. SIO2C4 TaxID=2607824 RepID=UPI0013C5A8CB|nr:tail fiber protein [Moorena sp. SIO2C4]NES45950.1 hypothetical protein [Moorena sp. SIO2C4]
MSEMPFGFTWCYEQTDYEDEQCNVLVIGEPEDVPPLDIKITNILPDNTIAIRPMDGVSQPDREHYHFKLAFLPGVLADPSAIAVESADWLVSSDSNGDEDSIYLLWTGPETMLSYQDTMEVILTGVAAQSTENVDLATTVPNSIFCQLLKVRGLEDIKTWFFRLLSIISGFQNRATTTNVNISWEFDQGGIEVTSPVKIPEGGDYDENFTLTLEMVQSSGKSNIPLYVGFVNCNKVLNTYDEVSTLQLRLTNTNLPTAADPDITFHYDADINLSSQLVVTLEVGPFEEGKEDNVPWALGTQDQVNNISISIPGDQWQQNGDIETIQVDGVVQGLQWTFIPDGANVVLAARKTMLINLGNIVTSHPTGEANLYLNYQYVTGYKDGQFVCQIEKAPLTFDTKVRVGTRQDLDGLLNVKDGISIDEDGKLKFDTSYRQMIDLSYDNSIYGIGLQTYTTYFRSRENFAWYKGGSHSDDKLDPGEGGTASMVLKNGSLGIGTSDPSQTLDVNGSANISGSLDVNGRIKDKTGYVIPVGTVVPYTGSSAPAGWLMCDGTSFDADKYPDLNNVLNSEKVPDLRNRFIVGSGSDYATNDTGGQKTVTLTLDQMPSHNHAPDEYYTYLLKVDGHYTTDKTDDTGSEPNLHSAKATLSKGGGQAHENRPPYHALNYIIKC